jgi:ABC-type nitrate/sulfonate/bicarbonate transport system permease component
MSARQRKYLPLAIRLAAVAIFVTIWDLSVRLGWIDPLFLASPLDTLEHLVPVAEHAAADLVVTLTAFLAALVAGVACALAVGLAVGLSNYGRKMLLPLFALGVTIPKVTLLPLFILWFGIAQTPVIVFGALSGFFPMVINVLTAGGEAKPNQVLLAKALGFAPLQIFRKVTLPAMLPVLVSGLFYACNASMMGVFIVELALARHGLGAVVHDLAVTFQTADMYAALLLTASITVAINMALWYAARYFGRWRY